MTHTIHHGDCLDVLRSMPDNSVDAICCDPPYGLSNTTPENVTDTIVRWAQGDREHVPTGKGFMGASWDAFVPPVAVWDECLRVLKPGGHLVAFAGSRTQDLMGLAIRLAGFDIRENLAWLYGSGFPKSLDVSKGIDKEANRRDLFEPIRTHIREWRDRNGMSNADLNAAIGSKTNGCGMARHWTSTEGGQHAIPSKDQWLNLKRALGWPDCELDELYASVKDGAERPVVGLHKSGLVTGASGVGGGGEGGSITAPATDEARRWSGYGTALKPAHEPIILARKPFPGTVASNVLTHGTGALNIDATRIDSSGEKYNTGPGGGGFTAASYERGLGRVAPTQGRWPSNVVLDPVTAEALDQQSGVLHTQKPTNPSTMKSSHFGGGTSTTRQNHYDDSNASPGASRFFKVVEPDPPFMYAAKAPKKERPRYEDAEGRVIQHPTTKPLSIMKWLVRLTCPEGGTVLDPFTGSGTTIEAAILEGFNVIGIEREAEYLPLIQQRIDRANNQLPLAS